MEESGDVGHHTAFVGMLSVAQISDLEELLCETKRASINDHWRAKKRVDEREYRGVPERLGKLGACYHGGRSGLRHMRIRPWLMILNLTYLVQLVVVNQVRSVAMYKGAPRVVCHIEKLTVILSL